MNIIAVPYGTDHQQMVRKGDTLRILVESPNDGTTWGGNVTLKTSFTASAAADTSLAEYQGGKVRNQNWDLYKDLDTSSLADDTKYLVLAEITSGSKQVELFTSVYVLPQGRS